LGHRFIPHTPPRVNNKELEETRRKLAWKSYFEQAEHSEREHLIKYSRNPPAPESFELQFNNAISKAKDFHDNVCERYQKQRTVHEVYKISFWKRELEALCQDGSRFLQCDKNLGVRRVDATTYKRLAERELKNYEATNEASDEIKGEAIKEDISQLLRVAQTLKLTLLHVTRNSDKEEIRKKVFLHDLSEFIIASITDERKDFKFPQLRLLLKIHKPAKRDGLLQTRPIVPNYCLPTYEIAKWLGRFMAKMAKQIPWNLESTQHFLTFITDPDRSKNTKTFDFTNLYGTEPVKETLNLFFSALFEMEWKFGIDDQCIFDALMVEVDCPEDIYLKMYFPYKTCVFMLLLAECIHCTMAELDMGDKKRIVATEKFLAMGCPPVAPLSIITLAYLESKHIGYAKCAKGLRRLIDDIVVDQDVIDEHTLRSAYPPYLELNHGDPNHFLDVQFTWVGGKYVHYPYIKPYTTVPLNINSCHPWHILRAAAKNELSRMIRLCSETTFIPAWTKYWRTKYSLAGYSIEFLRTLEKEVAASQPHEKRMRESHVNHIETWRGTETGTARVIQIATGKRISKTWKVERSLLSLALKAHVEHQKV